MLVRGRVNIIAPIELSRTQERVGTLPTLFLFKKVPGKQPQHSYYVAYDVLCLKKMIPDTLININVMNN